jgi:prepilin-type processing-associated H-X9-DG protein
MSTPKNHPKSKRRKVRPPSFTLIELIVVILVVGVVLFLVWPSTSGPRSLSPRLVCAANLKGIGTSMKLYAYDNDGHWPTPAFDDSAIGMIRYTVEIGGGKGTRWSPDRTQPSMSGPDGTTELSPTRALWMLVRSGDTTVKQFVCPSGEDEPASTDRIDSYYDFASYENVSYGYQVPFGPEQTRPRDPIDNRMILAADKGPYRDPGVALPPVSLSLGNLSEDWHPFNSNNHGGKSKGEGQNVLFVDGHVTFERTPIVGVDQDNIYTVMLDNQSESSRIIGESPWTRSAHPYAPFDDAGQPLSSTDSVIFP